MRKMNPSLSLAILGMAHLGLQGPHVQGFELGRHVDVTPEEKDFLDTLSGEPRRIWTRRVYRGLTDSERAFIKEKMSTTE